MNPSLLLLDEPLSALDALTRSVIQDQILEIQAIEKGPFGLVISFKFLHLLVLTSKAGRWEGKMFTLECEISTVRQFSFVNNSIG